jgi:hypothetical protein
MYKKTGHATAMLNKKLVNEVQEEYEEKDKRFEITRDL